MEILKENENERKKENNISLNNIYLFIYLLMNKISRSQTEKKERFSFFCLFFLVEITLFSFELLGVLISV